MATSAKGWSLGELSTGYRSSDRIAVFSNLGDRGLAEEADELEGSSWMSRSQ